MWWIPSAWAHDPNVPEPIAVHAAGDRVAIETSIGWFERVGAGFRWSCGTPLLKAGAASLPRYALRADGVRIAAVVVAEDAAGAVVSTSPDGCAWTGATGLDGVDVGGVTFAADGVAWLAADAPGGVWRSDDGGAAWTRVLADDGARVRAVVADGADVWAVGSGAAGATLWRGPAWTSRALPITGDAEVLAARGGVVWVRVDPYGGDQLLRVDDDGAAVVLDGDGLEILDVDVTADGRVWAVVGGRFLHVSDDGGRSFVRVDAPETTAIAADGDALWLAARMAVEDAALYRRAGDVDAPVFALIDAAGPLDCPAGPAADVCAEEWAHTQGQIPGFDTAGEDTALIDRDPPTRPCGCAARPAGATWLLGLAAVALRRRSRP